MADETKAQAVEALGEGFEITDEALEGVSGGKVSDPVCPKCGNTEEAYISGPNGYYVRYCTKCQTSWPYWV